MASRSTNTSISAASASDPSASDSSALEPEYLAVAQILAPHGVGGEVRCAVLTDFPERFQKTRALHVGEAYAPRQVERARLTKGGLLLKLRAVDSREDATALRGQVLYVPASDAVSLPEGSYFWHEIVGLEVLTTEGASLGRVAEILETGSNDVYVVRGEGRDLLIPAIADVVRQVDVPGGFITVELIEGLG